MKWSHKLSLVLGFITAVVVSAFLTIDALAGDIDRPKTKSSWEAYATPGGHVWGKEHAVTTGTTYVTTSTGAASVANHAQLFPWNTLVRVCCVAQSVFAWSQDWDDITLSANGWMEDSAGPDGIGATFRVEAGMCIDSVLLGVLFSNAPRPGRRAGRCTASSTSFATYGWPCEDDGDCVYAAATCDTTTYNYMSGYGAFLLATGDAATDCFVTVER